jgi:DNA-binding NarL/FixJ family response regulator
MRLSLGDSGAERMCALGAVGPATSAARAPRIASLAAQGVSLPEIARRLEMPYSTVHRIARHK